jgi:transposase InsO family protein
LNFTCPEGLLTAAALKNTPSALPLQQLKSGTGDYSAVLPLSKSKASLSFVVTIMDWYSRKVLAWQVSNTMDADFCVVALEEAIRRYGAQPGADP